MNDIDTIIIGSGIGGLSAGALLAVKGDHRVLILEKLPFTGGRCSSLVHNGYNMTTGAVVIEAGGALQQVFEEVGLSFNLRIPNPQLKYLIKGRQLEPPKKNAFQYLLSEVSTNPGEAEKVLKGFRETTELPAPDLSVSAWLDKWTKDPGVRGIFRALCGGILSLSLEDAGAAELIRLIRARSFRRFGWPPGGNSQLAEALVGVIEQRDGRIVTNAKVTDILVQGGRVQGVEWLKDGKGEKAACTYVISNVGIGNTVKLAGREWFTPEEISHIEQVKASYTLNIEIFSDRPLIDFPGILWLPMARRAVFAACPTLICPEWAPEGKHMTIILGPPSSSEEPVDGRKEFEPLLEDAKEFLPDFDEQTDEWITRSFRKDWPGFRARPGHGLGPITPVDGLFNVGDSVNPPAVYGVGGAVESARDVAKRIVSALS
jgi:phytoene dehydrogenase-like protein